LAMTPVELWAAITLNASHALNLREQGAVVPGLEPRLSIFKASTHEEIFYSWGHNLAIKI
jgi:imidazolonepropionase